MAVEAVARAVEAETRAKEVETRAKEAEIEATTRRCTQRGGGRGTMEALYFGGSLPRLPRAVFEVAHPPARLARFWPDSTGVVPAVLPVSSQIKDGDSHTEQKGEQKMSVRVISVNKGKGIDKGGEETLTTLNHKVSKLSLRGSYRKATDKFKRSRVISLFEMPKEEETGIGEKREPYHAQGHPEHRAERAETRAQEAEIEARGLRSFMKGRAQAADDAGNVVAALVAGKITAKEAAKEKGEYIILLWGIIFVLVAELILNFFLGCLKPFLVGASKEMRPMLSSRQLLGCHHRVAEAAFRGIKDRSLSIDPALRRIGIFDGGYTYCSYSTVRASPPQPSCVSWTTPDKTKNKVVHVQSFSVSQDELKAPLERVTHERWTPVSMGLPVYTPFVMNLALAEQLGRRVVELMEDPQVLASISALHSPRYGLHGHRHGCSVVSIGAAAMLIPSSSRKVLCARLWRGPEHTQTTAQPAGYCNADEAVPSPCLVGPPQNGLNLGLDGNSLGGQ
ncbi:hypothetical protein B0T24DRAFT_598126 [Lasiosphaeria ovina]|uniref:Uncharacterized protein n=1 Tax=Lasiosphaeria ovina TaxID=92902 RepID=A0AAE0JV19_9PEZI|nr:hypothetical protein B0T24DRAFT_598126 [Lasiosphaeria ovina]